MADEDRWKKLKEKWSNIREGLRREGAGGEKTGGSAKEVVKEEFERPKRNVAAVATVFGVLVVGGLVLIFTPIGQWVGITQGRLFGYDVSFITEPIVRPGGYTWVGWLDVVGCWGDESFNPDKVSTAGSFNPSKAWEKCVKQKLIPKAFELGCKECYSISLETEDIPESVKVSSGSVRTISITINVGGEVMSNPEYTLPGSSEKFKVDSAGAPSSGQFFSIVAKSVAAEFSGRCTQKDSCDKIDANLLPFSITAKIPVTCELKSDEISSKAQFTYKYKTIGSAIIHLRGENAPKSTSSSYDSVTYPGPVKMDLIPANPEFIQGKGKDDEIRLKLRLRNEGGSAGRDVSSIAKIQRITVTQVPPGQFANSPLELNECELPDKVVKPAGGSSFIIDAGLDIGEKTPSETIACTFKMPSQTLESQTDYIFTATAEYEYTYSVTVPTIGVTRDCGTSPST